MKISKLDKYILNRHIENGEEIFYVAHKHWIDYILNLFVLIILGIVMLAMIVFLFPKSSIYIIALLTILILIAVYIFFDWFCDILILSNEDLIHSEWNGFFKNSASRISYESIGTVGFESKGFLGSIFNYGDVIINKQGEKIIFKNISNPKKLESEFLIARNKSEGCEEESKSCNKEGLRNLLNELISEHMETYKIKKRGFE